jgi:ferredoxin, 2Fe-2S
LRTGAAIRFVEGCGASPMTKITFVDCKNNARIINVVDGDTVMRAAVDLGIKGIVAECGGNAICATCHVYVDEPWISKIAPAGRDESMLLDTTAAARQPNRWGNRPTQLVDS